MGIFGNKNLIKIAEDDLNDARLSSVDFTDEETRKRAFINILSARLAMKLLFSKKVEAGNYYSLYTIKNVLEHLDIADIYFKNVKIDVRLVFNENEIFIPKKQFEYTIQPDLYLILKLNEDMSSAELLGYFEPSALDKANANSDYYFFEKENLQKPDGLKKFLGSYKVENKLGSSEADLEKAEELILASVDDEISTSDRSFLFQQLAENIDLRGKFVEFENFELLSTKAALNETILTDNVLDIIGTQKIAEEDEDNLSLETVTFEDATEVDQPSAKDNNNFAETLAKGAIEGAVEGTIIAGGIAAGLAGAAAINQSASALNATGAITEGLSGLADMTGKVVSIGDEKDSNIEFKHADEFAMDDLISEIDTDTQNLDGIEGINELELELPEENEIGSEIEEFESFETETFESIDEAVEAITGDEIEILEEAEEEFTLDDLVSEIETFDEEEEKEEEVSIDDLMDSIEDLESAKTIENIEEAELETPEIEEDAEIASVEKIEGLEELEDFVELDALEDIEEIQTETEVKESEEIEKDLINETQEQTAENSIYEIELEELSQELGELEALVPEEIEEVTPVNEVEELQEEIKFTELSELPPLEDFTLLEMPAYIEGLSESNTENKTEDIQDAQETESINDLEVELEGDNNDVVELANFDFGILEDDDIKKEELKIKDDSLLSFDSLAIEKETDDTEVTTEVKQTATEEESIDLSKIAAEVEMLLQENDMPASQVKSAIGDDTATEASEIGSLNELDDLTAQIDELLKEQDSEPEETTTSEVESDTSSPDSVNEELKNLFKDEKLEALAGINETDLVENVQPKEVDENKKKRVIIAASVAGVMLVSIVAGTTILNNQNTPPATPTAPISADVQQPTGDVNGMNDTAAPLDQSEMPLQPDGSSNQADQYAPQANRDMGQAVSDAFTSEPINASVSKVAWEVPEELAYNDLFRKYLQSAGKNIKLTLQNDLLLSTELAYSNKMVIDITLTKAGAVQGTKIIISSGSKQIDKIVLQSVNETLKYLKVPAGELSSESVTATLIINF